MKSNENTLFATDFGANPQKEDNMQELRAAITECRGKKGLTLVISPGVYHIRDDEAIELRDLVMSGRFGQAFERMIFFPYAPYVKGLDFTGCENLIVQAEA